MKRGPGRRLATVLFTDIVGSTELASELGDAGWRALLSKHNAVIRKALKRFGGKEIDTAGDGFFATFDQPAAAITCASAMIDDLRRIGIQIRAGMHMGEVERMGAKVGGMAVHIGARVAAQAGPCEILVSNTVKDLVVGSNISFSDRGVHELKGVPGEWRVFAVERESLPELGPRPERERPAAETPGKRKVVVATALGAGIAGALIAVLLVSNGSAKPEPVADSVTSIDAAGRYVETAAVGHRPTGVAYGDGSIWVINSADGTLSQIDARSGKPSGSPRSIGGHPSDIAYGAGSVWVTTEFGLSGGSPGSLVRFDPKLEGGGKVIDAGSGARSVAFGEGSVWIANRITNAVTRIDPGTGGVIATIGVGNGPVDIAVGNGGVWVANALDSSVWKIDPSRNAVTDRFSMRSSADGLAVGLGSVWVLSASGNTITRIDAQSGDIKATISVGVGPVDVAVAGRRIWVTAGNAREVEAIDTLQNRISIRLKVPASPDSLVFDGKLVWFTVRTA